MLKKLVIIFTLFIMICNTGCMRKAEIGLKGYYNTPELALKHYNPYEKEWAVKETIDLVWLKDNPIIFYISKSNNFCSAEFDKKIVSGKKRWQTVSVGSPASLKKIKSIVPAPNDMGTWNPTIKNNPYMIFFGISKSKYADTIKIDWKTPTFKKFSFDGEKYTLWYIEMARVLDVRDICITWEEN